MKDKNIIETMFGSTPTSLPTSNTNNDGKTTVNLNKKDLGDSTVQTNLKKIGNNLNVNVVDEGETLIPIDNTLKYLSNVIDANTGEVSKPFTISDKRYQMVRGVNPSGEESMGVYCFDDVNESGENIVHSVSHFEENIALPMKETMGQPSGDFNYASAEKEYFDNEDFMGYLNLNDLGNAKLFFINDETGEVLATFKNIIDMATSGKKLGPNERLVNRKQLKAIRFGSKLKENISLSEELVDGVDVDTLKGDVKILINKMVKMFGNYFSKLNTDIEKTVFLTNIAKIVGVPQERLSGLLTKYREIAKTDEPSALPVNENKKVIKTIKVKDLI